MSKVDIYVAVGFDGKATFYMEASRPEEHGGKVESSGDTLEEAAARLKESLEIWWR